MMEDAQKEREHAGSQDSIVLETPPEQWDSTCEDEWEVEQEESPQGRAEEDHFAGEKENEKPDEKEETQRGDDPAQSGGSAMPKKTQEVHPQKMFAAVLEEIKAAPAGPPRETWKRTVAELYTVAHDKVTIKADLVPLHKQRYPKL
ncbi:hypothetical protein V7S43_004314 [Phytophthora oleae]|uniref:Uncharacterized protein n=1 Tax=Phytophthora oleae TaxID=2107226 RepID=A0ABD3FW24_9STRA